MRVKTTSGKIGIVGKIKVGEVSEKGYPVSLDYFRATGKHDIEFHKQFGTKPQSIKIVFIDEENSLDVRYELRAGKKLYAYSDGESVFAINKLVNKYVLQEKPFDQVKEKYADACKGKWEKILRLYFLIPEVKIWGLWVFETKGIESTIPTIEGSYDSVYMRAGTVVNIPFDLEVKKVVSQKPDSQNNYPVVSLIANMSDSSLERIRTALLSGNRFSGVITEEKINLIGVENE